ncbi:MAG: hypothetical protein ACRDPX_09825 [Gaiellaceae bacterium]
MDDPGVGFVCPGCGLPVSDDEPHILAREHTAEADVTLHVHDTEGTRRHFHVEHFRRRIGDCFYELVGSTKATES